MNSFKELFGVRKPIIGVVHFLPLPGTPLYDEKGGIKKILEKAIEDTEKLEMGGVDGLFFSNEADFPYITELPPYVVATITYLITKIKFRIKVPFGISALIDSIASISIAQVVGANFIRAPFITWAYVSDWGIMNAKAGELLRLRRNLHASKIKIFADIYGHCELLVSRDVGLLAHGASSMGLVDAVCISGPCTGKSPSPEDLQKAKEKVPSIPVLVGSGVNKNNVKKMLEIADGIIVASSLKLNGGICDPVDQKKVTEFMEIVKNLRKENGVN